MKLLKPNQIKFNDGLFELLKTHGLNDDELFECLRSLYPNKFIVKRIKRIPKVAEFPNLREVNEFIKDKTLRGTGVFKIIFPNGIYHYLVNYNEEV